MRTAALSIATIPFLFSTSCLFKYQDKVEEKELDIGTPTVVAKLNTNGNNLISFINTKLLTDTSRCLISQLGNYKFSTSIDAVNAFDSRYSPDVYIYYDYEGLQLRYIFQGAGMIKREELQSNLETYKKYIYLDEIIIEPKVYKGSLPFGLSKQLGPLSVEKAIGKHNSFFDSGGNTSKLSYTYPHKGLFIVFDIYQGSTVYDSTMQFITITDSISEMKRYPTLYPKYEIK